MGVHNLVTPKAAAKRLDIYCFVPQISIGLMPKDIHDFKTKIEPNPKSWNKIFSFKKCKIYTRALILASNSIFYNFFQFLDALWASQFEFKIL
jgi:hypothetical protein